MSSKHYTSEFKEGYLATYKFLTVELIEKISESKGIWIVENVSSNGELILAYEKDIEHLYYYE